VVSIARAPALAGPAGAAALRAPPRNSRDFCVISRVRVLRPLPPAGQRFTSSAGTFPYSASPVRPEPPNRGAALTDGCARGPCGPADVVIIASEWRSVRRQADAPLPLYTASKGSCASRIPRHDRTLGNPSREKNGTVQNIDNLGNRRAPSPGLRQTSTMSFPNSADRLNGWLPATVPARQRGDAPSRVAGGPFAMPPSNRIPGRGPQSR
jgi:hypothetical protein